MSTVNEVMEKEFDTKTVNLEDNENFVRVRTMCSDQDFVRRYYFSQIDSHKSLMVIMYLTDVMLDMSLMMEDILHSQMVLTTEQQTSLTKLATYRDNLSVLNLDTNIWELDWMSKIKQESLPLMIQFFEKRQELDLGIVLPIHEG